tara:strand:+ start:1658 stop:2161 length:504 start_codon:yes stop_codon:yes gene_type:complete
MFYKKFIINKIKKRALFDFLDSFDTEPVNCSSNINDERNLKIMSPSTIVENNKVDYNDNLNKDYDNEMKYIFGNLSDTSDEDSEFESESIPTETNKLSQNISSKLTSIDPCKKDKPIHSNGSKSQSKNLVKKSKLSISNRDFIMKRIKSMKRNSKISNLGITSIRHI